MRTREIALCGSIVLSLLFAPSNGVLSADEPAPLASSAIGTIPSDVDEQIREFMEHGGIPSLSAGIAIDGELVWARNYDGPVGLDSVYVVGSIQKPVTATAVLQLVEQGLLDLDEDVSTYVGFPVRHPGHPDAVITTRSLLTHRSGLGHDAHDIRNADTLERFGEQVMDIALPRLDGPPPSDDEYFAALLTSDAFADPSEVWMHEPGTVSYSNIGFDLLAHVVAKVSGQPFEQYAEEHIFEPLGMDHSGYSYDDLRPFHAMPYERVEDQAVFLDGTHVPLNARGLELLDGGRIELPLYEDKPGAGGLRTSILDLAEFLIVHMGQGLGSGGERILEAETADLMHTSAGASVGYVNSFPIVGQGMGWTLCEDGVEGHVGGQAGFGGTMMLKRADDHTVGIVLMMNLSGTYSDNEARWDWSSRWYMPLEQLLLETAEEMAATSR